MVPVKQTLMIILKIRTKLGFKSLYFLIVTKHIWNSTQIYIYILHMIHPHFCQYFKKVDTYHHQRLGGRQCGPAERWGGGGGGRPRRRREDLRGARGVGRPGRKGEAPRGRGRGIPVGPEGGLRAPSLFLHLSVKNASGSKNVLLDPSPTAAFLYVKVKMVGVRQSPLFPPKNLYKHLCLMTGPRRGGGKGRQEMSRRQPTPSAPQLHRRRWVDGSSRSSGRRWRRPSGTRVPPPVWPNWLSSCPTWHECFYQSQCNPRFDSTCNRLENHLIPGLWIHVNTFRHVFDPHKSWWGFSLVCVGGETVNPKETKRPAFNPLYCAYFFAYLNFAGNTTTSFYFQLFAALIHFFGAKMFRINFFSLATFYQFDWNIFLKNLPKKTSNFFLFLNNFFDFFTKLLRKPCRFFYLKIFSLSCFFYLAIPRFCRYFIFFVYYLCRRCWFFCILFLVPPKI